MGAMGGGMGAGPMPPPGAPPMGGGGGGGDPDSRFYKTKLCHK